MQASEIYDDVGVLTLGYFAQNACRFLSSAMPGAVRIISLESYEDLEPSWQVL
jgi:hypothetical protein